MIDKALIHKPSDRTKIGIVQIRHEEEESWAEHLFRKDQESSEVKYKERSKKPMEAKGRSR